jgi:ATP synthase subunit 6
MINRLFSSFDPINRRIRINLIVYTSPILIPTRIWILTINSRITSRFDRIKNFIISELRASLNSNFLIGKINILTGTFLSILILNLIGLVPYVYTLTAQLIFTLRIRLPIWIGAILFCISKNNNIFLAHIVPSGTPIALSQFMSIIETVRQIIRPITLSVRLAANITAGHILIALSRAPILINNHIRVVLTTLLILELAVAIIQRYVFVILISIYLRETK